MAAEKSDLEWCAHHGVNQSNPDLLCVIYENAKLGISTYCRQALGLRMLDLNRALNRIVRPMEETGYDKQTDKCLKMRFGAIKMDMSIEGSPRSKPNPGASRMYPTAEKKIAILGADVYPEVAGKIYAAAVVVLGIISTITTTKISGRSTLTVNAAVLSTSAANTPAVNTSVHSSDNHGPDVEIYEDNGKEFDSDVKDQESTQS